MGDEMRSDHKLSYQDWREEVPTDKYLSRYRTQRDFEDWADWEESEWLYGYHDEPDFDWLFLQPDGWYRSMMVELYRAVKLLDANWADENNLWCPGRVESFVYDFLDNWWIWGLNDKSVKSVNTLCAAAAAIGVTMMDLMKAMALEEKTESPLPQGFRRLSRRKEALFCATVAPCFQNGQRQKEISYVCN
jgi:hypothetical protein